MCIGKNLKNTLNNQLSQFLIATFVLLVILYFFKIKKITIIRGGPAKSMLATQINTKKDQVHPL